MRVLPESFSGLVRTVQSAETALFPPTEIYNETWMLRLLLDAIQSRPALDHPLRFLDRATWCSEFRLPSIFRPRKRGEKLGEGYTKADGVIGHVQVQTGTRTGLTLARNARQFVVIEAKMFSRFSSGTTNAIGYHQVARTVACMATMIAEAGLLPASFTSLGFSVLGPQQCLPGLRRMIEKKPIRMAVCERIGAYEKSAHSESKSLRQWEKDHLHPLLEHCERTESIRFLSWEEMIERLPEDQRGELRGFYAECLKLADQGKPD